MRLLYWLMIMGGIMFSCQEERQPADTIFQNGRFWTADPGQPRSTVLAVKGGKIIYMGNKIPEGLSGKHTKVIDLENHFVLPGMIDSHLHLMEGGLSLSQIDLRHCRSKTEFIQKIADYAKKLPGIIHCGAVNLCRSGPGSIASPRPIRYS
jgi:predicted amidohydrolase YtcJ